MFLWPSFHRVSQDQPTQNSLLRQFSTDSVGYALAAVIALSMLAGFGVQLKLEAEHSRVTQSIDRWAKATEDTASLNGLFAATYVSGNRPETLVGIRPGARAAQARRDFETRFASLAEELRAAPPASGSEPVLEKLAAVRTAAEAFLGEMDPLTTAESVAEAGGKPPELTEALRVFDERYWTTIAACESLRALEAEVTHGLAGERDRYWKRVHLPQKLVRRRSDRGELRQNRLASARGGGSLDVCGQQHEPGFNSPARHGSPLGGLRRLSLDSQRVSGREHFI